MYKCGEATYPLRCTYISCYITEDIADLISSLTFTQGHTLPDTSDIHVHQLGLLMLQNPSASDFLPCNTYNLLS